MADKLDIKPATGKLGILTPGMGAVSSTFMAGVIAIRKGLRQPIGSFTQMGHIRLGKRTEDRQPLVRNFVPLAELGDIVFGGWDIFPDSVYAAALNAGVLEKDLLEQIRPELEAITPMPAVFNNYFVKKLDGDHVKKGTKMEMAEALMQDMENFKKEKGCDRLVVVWCGSTEIFMKPAAVHADLASFEKGLMEDHPDIAPSMIYAYAAIKKGIPYVNGAPNLSFDFPALEELAKETGAGICGKDFKTGQTLLKTILAPGFKARQLGVSGWFSTNILGNRDGEVLDDPESFKTKEESKLSVLDSILQPELYPDLYENLYHKVRINYYPPRGDNKEGWDNIDIFGWCGRPMQIKIDFLCRDSILAAPLVLDLALLLDLGRRAGLPGGIQEWLSFYFKSPVTPVGLKAEHDLFIQQTKLKNTLRWMMGEDVITHLGREYYDG
ncbi:inositol-3-phosphate synthase [bacterium]|nr:inositol-3-phosphate synthase [bacterium]PIV80388.1 MAG: inositol-3-phosphate synthase [bacterium CG17_big_fil_post_rev_8_21_14_2_50_64_8]PJA75601.1 MAG: inositol-3-phosphate synthase [bacterium CG_4_9_14_3_um_filter_65_15]